MTVAPCVRVWSSFPFRSERTRLDFERARLPAHMKTGGPVLERFKVFQNGKCSRTVGYRSGTVPFWNGFGCSGTVAVLEHLGLFQNGAVLEQFVCSGTVADLEHPVFGCSGTVAVLARSPSGTRLHWNPKNVTLIRYELVSTPPASPDGPSSRYGSVVLLWGRGVKKNELKRSCEHIYSHV